MNCVINCAAWDMKYRIKNKTLGLGTFLKKLMALQLIACSMSAMEHTELCKLDISWAEMVEITRKLHYAHGDKLDIHELLLAEVKPPVIVRQDSIPRLIRRNTNEKIGDGIKFAHNKLLGIRKISSCP